MIDSVAAPLSPVAAPPVAEVPASGPPPFPGESDPAAIAAQLAAVPLFVELNAAQRRWVASLATPGTLQTGDYLFRQGEEETAFFVLITGRAQVSKLVGETELVYTVHEPGSFTGELPLLMKTPYVASLRAVSPLSYLRFSPASFQQLLGTFPCFTSTVLRAVAERMKSMTLMLSQHEKLSALGTLAAGLAHELNNPAAAIRRAADQLLENEVAARAAVQELCAGGVPPAVLAELGRLAATAPPALGLEAMALSDAEDALGAWLDAEGVAAAWDVAAPLAAAGLTPEQLAPPVLAIPAPARDPALRWLAASLQTAELAGEIDDSATRISALVKSVKQYSYMDQAPQQHVDVREGLEATLKLFSQDLRGVTVVRDYVSDLPRIDAFGRELNQVWTNIIDNALDAMGGHGTLRLRATRELDRVLVEIGDSGPGIPADVKDHIFEPFFTTKDVGEGTGLGLDIAYRIVVGRHGGAMSVHSEPGDTRFAVWLPLSAAPTLYRAADD